MKNALSWTLILMLGGVKCQPSIFESIPPPLSYETLFLTPYIENKSLIQARNASKVDLFEKMANVMAYSGFITVDSRCNSNLFFLFLVSKNNKTDDPLMLWTQGGPGLSALFGELLENGPIAFDTENTYR
uniref:Putative serine carboxypeptidase n=1 Tax=Rhipicephalus microplus TaxID=6941 RepID=A0A6G4ZXZ3_RHIMP